jgi:hypothetical protein
MATGEYEYEIIDVDDAIINFVKSRLEEGENLITTANEEDFSAEHMAWVKSFSSVIDVVDPKGEDYSNSLSSRWHAARWYGGNSPKDKYEQSIVFGQYLAIVRSLLLGKVKVVKSKLNKFHSTSIFHRRELLPQSNLVFVLMPFTESWSDYIWNKQIKSIVQAIEGTSLICKRADDLFGHDVMQDIYESIVTAAIIIADITNKNANVFYELGIAHSFGKDVILLSQGTEHIPFDLNRYRHCIYSNDGPGYEILNRYIPKAIKDILSGQHRDRA